MVKKNELSKNENKSTIIYLIVFSIVIAFNVMIMKTNLSFYIIIPLLLFFMVLKSNNKIKSLFFLLPFQNILVVQNISFYSIIQIIILIDLLLKNKKYNLKEIIALVFLIVLQLITVFRYDSNIVSIISFVVLIFCYVFIFKRVKMKCIELDSIKISFIFGLFVSSIIALPEYIELSAISSRLIRFSGLWVNPNIYGFQLVLATSLSISLILNKSKNRYFYVLFILAFMYFVTLTYSRSSVFALIIMFLILIFTELKTLSRSTQLFSNKTIFVVIILLISLPFIFARFISPIIEQRGLFSSGDDFTSGRFTFAIDNISWLFKNMNFDFLIYGLGIDNSLIYFSNHGIITQGSHNAFIEMSIESGIVGLLIWMFVLFNPLGLINMKNKNINLYILVVPIFYMFTAHIHNSNILYMAFIMSYKNFTIKERIGEEI